MMRPATTSLEWVVLTMGDRGPALDAAVASLGDAPVHVVYNGVRAGVDGATGSTELEVNVGVPGGRDVGVGATDAEIVGFLDDDAVAPDGASDTVLEAFRNDSRLGAVSLRLVDERGRSARRHVPRPGGRHPDRSGDVALFLGGACAIRREAYDEVGGYFTELFYGHEEVELAWRLIDGGWHIRYLADVEVFHPETSIERHPEGWELTGRNRVWIARRTLPWLVALVHVSSWLVLGALRAPRGESRRRYLSGWKSGWRGQIDRAPIRWATVWRLIRLGRPPLI